MSFRRSVTRRTQAAGTEVNGHYTEGAKTDTVIKASIQPASQTDIETLPEGRRNHEAFRVYTDTKLNTERDDENSDSILYDGKEYEVMMRLDWQNNVINHYKYLVVKLGNIL